MRTPLNRLFGLNDFSSSSKLVELSVRSEIEDIDRQLILNSSETNLIDQLYQKHRFRSLRLTGEVQMEEEAVKIDLTPTFESGVRHAHPFRYGNGQKITVYLKYEGDPSFFFIRPSQYEMHCPEASVEDDWLLLSFSGVRLASEEIMENLERHKSCINRHLGWSQSDCSKWNEQLRELIASLISKRKEAALQQIGLVSALKIPLRRRLDAAETYALPVERRRRPESPAVISRAAFHPEPTITHEDYDHMLWVIDRLATQVERSPTVFEGMKEEHIRDILLVHLNGHYEGGATGETFNSQGKTDILIRENGGTAFIAECKFWSGAKAANEAIDQLLSYLTWRDTKASLVVFSKNIGFSDVLTELRSAITAHPCFKKELGKVGETHMRYLFRLPQDENRDVYLATQAFNIPRKT